MGQRVSDDADLPLSPTAHHLGERNGREQHVGLGAPLAAFRQVGTGLGFHGEAVTGTPRVVQPTLENPVRGPAGQRTATIGVHHIVFAQGTVCAQNDYLPKPHELRQTRRTVGRIQPVPDHHGPGPQGLVYLQFPVRTAEVVKERDVPVLLDEPVNQGRAHSRGQQILDV